MSVFAERRRRRPEINIVSLVDVLVTLIFFFLVTMQFRDKAKRDLQAMNINPPKIESAGKAAQADKQFELRISKEGGWALNDRKLSPEQAEVELRRLGREQPGTPVLIIADEESILKDLTRAMDLCRAAGLEKIRLQSR